MGPPLDIKFTIIRSMVIETLKDPKPNDEAAHLLKSGHFRFRRLSEAYVLAKFFSAPCPNPTTALVGISEMLVNAIEHGNLGISSKEKEKLQAEDIWVSEIERRVDLPEHQHKFVEVQFMRTETEIQLTITDQGDGFNSDGFNQPLVEESLATHGRGILMAKKLSFKRLEYSKKGNEVFCTIALN